MPMVPRFFQKKINKTYLGNLEKFPELLAKIAKFLGFNFPQKIHLLQKKHYNVCWTKKSSALAIK
jgi:hypothetical protein